MPSTPFADEIVFHIGPVPIAGQVVTTWIIMAALALVCWLGLRRRQSEAGGLQTVLEIFVETMSKQVREVIQRDPAPYLPLLGTLFVFLLVANLSATVPGVSPPTAHLETPAALALIVFFSSHVYGVQAQGLGPYLRHYVRPNALMLPLNLLAEITRTFALAVRLFGNIMSHEIVLAILLLLAGLFLPVPFLLLGVLIGTIQAYIFTILATIFLGAAVGSIATE
ncbi:MAG: F0F1 ATP synthase subunit A [Rhodospirillaceae bacterium]|nr:F0F1 ATP synthase subunit A [Rhodospirillaceae bacterium]